MKTAKILIVEDQDLVSSRVKKILNDNEFTNVTSASSAEAAIELIRRDKPNLVLMDIFLPGGMDGIKAAEIIKSEWQIPILFLTANKAGLTFQKAKKSGADGYLIKDTSLNDQLVLQVEFTLDKFEIEKALHESEEKFRVIAQSIQDAVITVDNDDRITFWNYAAERMFGYEPAEALGKKLHYLLAPEKYMKDYFHGFSKFKTSGEGPSVGKILELEAKRRNGEIFPVEISLSAMIVEGKWNACGVVRDITDRKKFEKALLESQKELSIANSAKDKFFSIIAHDLKSPLGSIRNMMELMVMSFESFSSAEIKEWLVEMNSSTKNLFSLLEDLLYWSRANLGKLEFFPDMVDLSLIAILNINLLKLNSDKKNLTVVQSIPKGSYVYADTNMLNTIFRNLISNAIKFTNVGGKVEVSSKSCGDFIEVTVEDNGVGIKPENLEKLFRIDISFTTVGTDKEKGTGLGLVICKEFIELHKGGISVESIYGEGSKFTFKLPVEANFLQ